MPHFSASACLLSQLVEYQSSYHLRVSLCKVLQSCRQT